MISKSIVLEPGPPCDLVHWVWIGTVVTGWNFCSLRSAWQAIERFRDVSYSFVGETGQSAVS